MTTEKNRTPFHPFVFFAALGLLSALFPSAASAAAFSVSAVSTAPASVDATSANVPVIYVDLTPSPAPASLGTTVVLNLFGDVPANLLSVTLWRDEGADGFSVANDTPVASAAFNPPNAGFPARAILNTLSEPALTGGTTRYYFTVSFNGVPVGRKLSFGFQLTTDLTNTSNNLPLPFFSNPTVVRAKVFAKPSDGNYPTPTGGATRSGGLDTGLFLQAGQRVRSQTIPGILWNVSSSTNADGIPASEGVAVSSRGLLIGRIGAGQWLPMGQSSTITATSNGTLYVAANDGNYADNSGFVSVTFDILPSTTPKVWIGGTLGFETAADIPQNWVGGRPFNGESVVIGAASSDIDWNLPNMILSNLTVSTAYTGNFRLVPPPYQYNNRLQVDGNATIAGGWFSLAASSASQFNTFVVKGKLVVKDTATFDASGAYLDLGLGAEFRTAALLKVSNFLQIRRAIPSAPYYLRVDRATVNVTGAMNLDGIDYIDLIDPAITAFNNVNFNTNQPSTSPFVRLGGSVPSYYTLDKWDGGSFTRNPAVIASAVAVGSIITFNDSTANPSSSFGSPATVDPNGAVKWTPDGGGGFSSVAGNVSFGVDGSYLVVASTSPSGVDNVTNGGGGNTPLNISGGVGAYTVSSLRAPSTYYLFAYANDGSNVAVFSPRGGFGHAGFFRSEPVFITNSVPATNVNFAMQAWGAVGGYIGNQSNQTGPIIVESWAGPANVATSTKVARGVSSPQTGYFFYTKTGAGAELFAYIDANRNDIWDAFEANGTASAVNIPSASSTTVNFSAAGGSPAPGGTVSLSTQAVHSGALGRTGHNPLIRSRLTASGSPAELSAVTVRYQGTVPRPDPGAYFAVWADNGDGIFNPAQDTQRGTAPIPTNFTAPSTYTVTLTTPVALPVGAPKDFFVTVDLANWGMPNVSVGVMIDAATSYTLSAGSFSGTPSFPIQTGGLPVLTVVRASETATPEFQGGANTQAFFFPGQMVSVTSFGTWSTGSGDAPTGPGGAPGTTGLNTVLPSANRGELIGRVQMTAMPSSPWVRIGASSTPFASPGNGQLYLAINDFVGAYSDNTGAVFAGFAVSGSSVGSLAGQVFYSTPVAGTLSVTAMNNQVAVATVSFGVSSSSAYPFIINGLAPGVYTIAATNSANSDLGVSVQETQVQAGATSYTDLVMYQGTGNIYGTISYAGVLGQGSFHVGVATVTDFTGQVHFYGGYSSSSAGAYSITALPAPATYYLVAYRDGDNNNKPNGAEPLGYYGTPGGSLSTLPSFVTPLILNVGGNLTSVNVSLSDTGAIEGSAVLLPGATGALVVETGRGLPGSASYVNENRAVIPIAAAGPPPGGVPYNLGLLRPATGYSLFAFVDKNRDGQPSAGEEQFAAASVLAVPSGGRARFDFSLATLGAPPAPSVFTPVVGPSDVTFNWNLVPGATAYQLRRADSSVILALSGSTSVYMDSLAPNTSSQIRGITASNGNGTSAITASSATYTFSATPSAPVVSGMTALGATLTWGGPNPPGTVYELHRATDPAGVVTRVFTGTANSAFNPLAPASTYFWAVVAENGNGVKSAFTSLVSTVTLPLSGPSLSGTLSYAGFQTAGGRGFVIEASTSATTFFPRASSAALPGAPFQPWFLQVPAGTYFTRAFVDLAGNGVLQAIADRGQTATARVVSASSVTGVNFTVIQDTVPPGAPAGVLAIPGNNKVTLSWAAPTKNANNTNLLDLAGYEIERSTSVPTAFSVLSAVSSSALTFVDNFPIPGIANLYRLRAFDVGANRSSPSGAVSGVASSGGSISGQIRDITPGTGEYRVRLSTLAASGAVSIAERGVSSFTFTGLADGVYYLRAFRDANFNGVQDALTDPAGTFGGLNLPFPIAIVNGNAVSGADATICPRSALQPPSVSGTLTFNGCPALDKGPGFVTSLYALSVGAGIQGSLGLGTQVNLAVSTATDFATDLILLGPDGRVAARDNRVGGANLTTTLSTAGIYLAELTSFQAGTTGQFQLNIRLEGGFAGNIAGAVNYSGVRTGKVYAQLFNQPSPTANAILTSTATSGFPTPSPFSFAGLPDGAYYLRSFLDTNFNGVRDNGEPQGQFGVSASSAAQVIVAGGLAAGAPFSVTIADPAVGVIRGAVLYNGTASGFLRVEAGRPACSGCSSIAEVVAFSTVAPGGIYNLPFIPSATDYVVRAFLDGNSNGRNDALEPTISSFPINVFVNATSTISLIVADAGGGAEGAAIVVGTVTYLGSSTGPVIMGLSRDPQFRSVDYLITLSTTGYFERAGLQGGTSYYMAGFIDNNLSNGPDADQGEPVAAGALFAYAGAISFDNPPAIFVEASGQTAVKLNLKDPSNGQMFGTVRYTGASAAPTLVVQAYASSAGGFVRPVTQTITRSVGVSTYAFHLNYLDGETYSLNAFIDANNNGYTDFGEPSGYRPQVSVSSGVGAYPFYGADVDIRDPGSLGATANSGRIRGQMTYLGTQTGPMFVRFFNNPDFLGAPLYTARVPATGPLPDGSGDFSFDRSNLPFGTYYLDAFRDPSGTGLYNPAAHAHGVFLVGVEISPERSEGYAHSSQITDPGMAGSVNAFTGSFAAPGGARFDGGATDLGVLVVVDSTTASGPQPIVIGVTAQNDGVDSLAVRYSSSGVMISSRIVQVGDLSINSLATDGTGNVYIPGRRESQNSYGFSSTGTLTKFDANFGLLAYAEFPNYQGLDGIAYGGGFVYAASRHFSSEIRALKIDPVTFVTVATGAFVSPVSCQYCNTRSEGAALSPNGAIYIVYAIVNQQNDSDRGLHFLLKFDSSMNLVATRDITDLGFLRVGGPGVSLAVNNSGAAYLAFPTDGDTARTFKFDVSGSAIVPLASTAYAPILVHFSGLGNLQLDPANGYPYEVWESTTGAGDYVLLRYDPSLNLIGQTFFDGLNNTLEDIGFSLSVYNSSMVFVTGSVNNGRNLDWGTVRLNANASSSISAAGTAVIITTANAVNYISGTVTYGGSLVTSGTVRMSLIPTNSYVPIRFATGTFAASTPFLFNNVPDGQYDVRVFIDPNNNLSSDEGEAVGATTLYGINHAAVSGSQILNAPVQLCDRRQIAFDVDVLHALGATDCTSPDRAGAARRLYTFRGTRGQPVSILMKAIGFYDSYLDLYDPNGDWIAYDDDLGGSGNALISNFVLPQDGVYTIDASAYAGGTFGQFKLSLSGSAGALGGVAGRVNYSGSQGGAVIVGLFDAPTFSSTTNVGRAVLTSTRAFAFANLAVGTTYYLGAFIDVNANNAPDQGEDGGVFGLAGAPNPILLASGQVASGIEIAVNPSTAGAATVSYVTGVSTYTGTRTGALVLEFWSSSSFSGRPIASRVVPTGVGSYDVAVPGGNPYYVRAFVDANGDFALQPDEPRGVYAPNNQGAEPVFVPVAQSLVGIDLTLKDPGVTAGGAIAGAGTAVLSSTFVVAGELATIAVTYTAAVSSIASGGQIGFTVPPGFPFPIFSAGVSSVTATSTATTVSAVTYSGPSAFVTVGLPGLALGQTVRFVWSNFPVPCAVGNATVTVSAVQNGTATPQPLFLGSPALAVTAGLARFVQLDEPYFSVKQGELSGARRLETRDRCGTPVPVTAPLIVDLRTRRYDGSNFVADTEVGVTTNTALSTVTVVGVDFAIGESSKTFYVLAASTGFKNLELHYALPFATTFYFGVTAVPADALTAVTVSTAASGAVALSSASIGLAANGQPNLVFINFTLGDRQQPWRVLVSSFPFKAGETPVAVWERGGFGQPNPGEVAWDGRYLPWINGGSRVPNGLYYGRVEVGSGSGVKDDSIRLTVALPQFAGVAYDPGTVPNPPLSGVSLRVYGPAGYFTTETGANGSYVLPGLGAGSYRLNTSRADYVDGSIDMTLNAAGAATSFISRTTGLLVSSNAVGGLDLFIGRAPRLIVVPSLDPSVAAIAESQWGSLQVRPSTSIVNGSTFYGPMRLKGGTTTFDDGGQWDSASQSFIEKTLLGFNVPIGTYTVLADLNGYSRSTGSVYVGADGARLDLTPFLPKAVVTGQVGLGVGNALGYGLPVGISAVALSTSVASASLSAGAFINAGSTYAVYSISGFDAGSYLLRANTQGLSAVTTGPIVVAGTAAVSGIDFPNFGAGASITGTISVTAPNGTRIFVNAWSPGSFNFGSTVVYVAANSASYALTGLDSGVPYQLYANIDAQGSYDVDGGFPRSVTPPAVDSFTLKTASGVISGVIILRAGATDFANVTLTGIVTASLHPDEIGSSFVEISTTLPNFLCGDGSSGATGYCPAGVSSATFRVQGVNTQTFDLRFLHSTTGQSSRHTVSAVNGSTVSLVSDLSASTYSISGFLINQITDAVFNTNAKIVANAPYIKPQGYPVGLSSTTARVTAVRQQIDSFGVAISTVFDPVSSRVGFLNDSGAFTIPNVPNGVYVVRTTDLRSCATCAVVVPSVGRLVTVSGAAVSSVTLTVSNGFSVAGTISLDGGIQDARIFQINILNRRQEIVRSTVAYLGDLNLGAVANSVDYSFTNLPAGEFYTLTVRGQLFPIKYAGRPIKFPDAALSPNGLQSNLTNQNVLMQRAAYIVGRLKDGKTGELVTATNATLLAPNFGISATANPWTEGGYVTAASSISNRPIDGDGYFRVGPLVPDVAYDLRLAQTTWDPNFLASGSQNFAPVTIGGIKPTPGEIRDVGIVALGQGQSITGIVRSTGTLALLSNIKVTARPSFANDDSLVVQTFTNQQGAYSLWVSSIVSNQFTLTAAPRDGNQAGDGRYYGTVERSNINLQTQTSANFLLQPLAVVVTGQILVADAATGGALSYPFGDKRGFPAAAINLQPVGVVSDNPLGDISATTVEVGFFSVPGLSTGFYRLNATSLGYAVKTATIQVIGASFSIFTGSNTQTGGVLTLARGATATGRILKSDGTSPNSSEVVGVAAANFGAGEFVVGSVETDPVAKTVNAYTISGFKPGISYNIVLLSGSNGKEVSFPTEGAGVVFTASESTTTKTINLTYRPARLDCLGTAKALDAARSRFLVQVDCLKPLRQATAADDDLTTILTVSTFTAAGAALAAPNGAGVLNNPSIATTRRLLTATYTLAALETRFSIRIRASAAEIDPNTGDSFNIDKVFDFYAGLDSSADGRASNINGGKVGMKPSANDELLGLDERSGIDLSPGSFGEGSDSLADAGIVANPTTTVNVSMTKGRDQALAKALSIAAVGYAPAALQVPDNPSAFPAEMWAAMSQYRTSASTTQVGGANPISAFYSIFLPAGIRHQLKQRADLTLSYNLSASTSTTDDKIQIWFYNAVLGRFVPETINRRLDTVNKTITVSVDHFSTFVVLDSTPTATSTVSFGGTDLAVANFPNPADCISHANIARNSTLFGSGGVHAAFTGTMFRTSVPPNSPPRELKYNIYTVTGEKVRTIEQGVQLSGQTYYTPWNCQNDAGATVASGVYIGEVTFGGLRKFFKIAIIKGSGL